MKIFIILMYVEVADIVYHFSCGGFPEVHSDGVSFQRDQIVFVLEGLIYVS